MSPQRGESWKQIEDRDDRYLGPNSQGPPHRGDHRISPRIGAGGPKYDKVSADEEEDAAARLAAFKAKIGGIDAAEKQPLQLQESADV